MMLMFTKIQMANITVNIKQKSKKTKHLHTKILKPRKKQKL